MRSRNCCFYTCAGVLACTLATAAMTSCSSTESPGAIWAPIYRAVHDIHKYTCNYSNVNTLYIHYTYGIYKHNKTKCI